MAAWLDLAVPNRASSSTRSRRWGRRARRSAACCPCSSLRGEHLAVGQDGRCEADARGGKRAGGGPGRGGGIIEFGGGQGRAARVVAAHREDLPVGEQVGAVLLPSGVKRARGRPSPGGGVVELAGGQPAAVPAAGDEDLAGGQQGGRRVLASGAHGAGDRPSPGDGVVELGAGGGGDRPLDEDLAGWKQGGGVDVAGGVEGPGTGGGPVRGGRDQARRGGEQREDHGVGGQAVGLDPEQIKAGPDVRGHLEGQRGRVEGALIDRGRHVDLPLGLAAHDGIAAQRLQEDAGQRWPPRSCSCSRPSLLRPR